MNKDSVEYVKTKAVVATFGNFLLPPFVHILGKKIYFNPFVQRVILCKHCLRYGHSIGICKILSKPGFCMRCDGPGHEAEECKEPRPKCINCCRFKCGDTSHAADSPNCPSLLQQKEVKKLMAINCWSALEAIKFINNNTGNTSVRYSGRNPAYPTLAEFMPPGNHLYSQAAAPASKQKTQVSGLL